MATSRLVGHWHGLPFERVAPPEVLHLEELTPPESMLWVTLSGRADHSWRERSTPLRTTIRPGDIAFKLGGHALRDYRTVGHYTGCCMYFPDRQVRALMGEEDSDKAVSRFRDGVGYQTGSDAFVLQAMRTIDADIDAGCLMGSAFAEAISISLVSYLVLLRTGRTTDSKPVRDTVRIERAKEFIEAHLSEDVSLADIAAEVHLGPRQLARAFQTVLGCSVHRHVLERRIARARSMLLHQTATDVSIALGFSSPSHFAQMFRSLTGSTPTEYKRSMS